MRIIQCDQGSTEWWEARRGVPSASNFGKIITPAKGQLSAQADDYIAELLAEQVDGVTPEDLERPINREMQHGIDTEAEARAFYAMEAGAEIVQVGFCLTDDGRFGCSPDGLVGEDGLLELKCPSLKTQVKYLLAGTLPDEYKAQVHGQLLVTGRKWVDFLSYAPGLSPFLLRVEPDDFTIKLLAALGKFWTKYQAAREKIFGESQEAIHAEAMAS